MASSTSIRNYLVKHITTKKNDKTAKGLAVNTCKYRLP